jgi:DNA-binding response OmpR family regulator
VTNEARRVVLLVEDDPNIRSLVEFRLKREGLEVRMAVDGEEALAQMQGDTPDLVIMDVMIPYRSGYEVLAAFRSNPAWSQVPVIMLTSLGREEDVTRALTAGANDYLTKPFRPGELLARVQRLLRPR